MKILFEVRTPLNVTIRITEEYWRYIVEIKHKIMANKGVFCKRILAEPDEVREA